MMMVACQYVCGSLDIELPEWPASKQTSSSAQQRHVFSVLRYICLLLSSFLSERTNCGMSSPGGSAGRSSGGGGKSKTEN